MTNTLKRLLIISFCLAGLLVVRAKAADTSTALAEKAEARRVQEEARTNAEYRKLMLAAKLASLKVDAHIAKRRAGCAAIGRVLTSGGDGEPTCGPPPPQSKPEAPPPKESK